ncbi:MAG: heat shock protein HspQ [Kiloniellales bacterium]
MSARRAKFQVGQLVEHRLFDYRGVVYDVDPVFQGTEEWYETVARTRPPKDQPWYHVLVHNGIHGTYVAERNLKADDSDEPIVHPATDEFFDGFAGGKYIPRRTMN